MKNYLVIENQGEIIVEDLILFGSSTKRGDATKIGQFGSGNKYGLPRLIRGGCTPIIYSGTKELKVETKRINHRGFDRDVIFIDGKDSSITTDAGPKWDMWMALREIYSNAIDEGDEKFYTTKTLEEAIANKREGRTLYIIPINGEVREVVENFEKYFAFELTPDFISNKGFVYIVNQGPLVTYRKGIRCIRDENSTDYPKSFLSFNFNEVDIEEDRIADMNSIRVAIYNVMKVCDDPKIWRNFFLSRFKPAFFPDYIRLTEDIQLVVINTLEQMVKEGYQFTTNTYKSLLGDTATNFKEGIEIPSEFYQQLVLKSILIDPIGVITSTIDIPHIIVKPTHPEIEAVLERMFPMLNVTVSLAKYESYASAYAKSISLELGDNKTPVTVLIKEEKYELSKEYMIKHAIMCIAKNLPTRAFSNL